MTSSKPPDEILLLTSGMKAGDETAFCNFHRLYFQRLFRYAIVLTHGDEGLAQEITQETMVRVVKFIKPFHSSDHFWSWLTVLLKSSWIDSTRKRNRYWARLRAYFLELVTRTTVHESNFDRNLERVLNSALDALPNKERTIVTMKYLEAKSVREIASDLAMTEKAVESQLARIRKSLKIAVLKELQNE